MRYEQCKVFQLIALIKPATFLYYVPEAFKNALFCDLYLSNTKHHPNSLNECPTYKSVFREGTDTETLGRGSTNELISNCLNALFILKIIMTVWQRYVHIN